MSSKCHRYLHFRPSMLSHKVTHWRADPDPQCVCIAHRRGGQKHTAECQELDAFTIPRYHMASNHWHFWELALITPGTRILFFFLFLFLKDSTLWSYIYKCMFLLCRVSLWSAENICPILRSKRGEQSSVLSSYVTLTYDLFCKKFHWGQQTYMHGIEY